MTASLLDSMLLSYKNRNEIMLSTDIRMPLYITNFLTVVHRVQIFQLMQRFQNKKGTQASQVSIAPVRKCGGIFWECAPHKALPKCLKLNGNLSNQVKPGGLPGL